MSEQPVLEWKARNSPELSKDHKSTPQGRDQWGDLAITYAGQLAAYRVVLQATRGLPAEELWLILPVAGAALQVEVEVG